VNHVISNYFPAWICPKCGTYVSVGSGHACCADGSTLFGGLLGAASPDHNARITTLEAKVAALDKLVADLIKGTFAATPAELTDVEIEPENTRYLVVDDCGRLIGMTNHGRGPETAIPIDDSMIAEALSIYLEHERGSRSEAIRHVLLWAQERFGR
jgi:hypothetical protein